MAYRNILGHLDFVSTTIKKNYVPIIVQRSQYVYDASCSTVIPNDVTVLWRTLLGRLHNPCKIYHFFIVFVNSLPITSCLWRSFFQFRRVRRVTLVVCRYGVCKINFLVLRYRSVKRTHQSCSLI